jgi:hypothetical protein
MIIATVPAAFLLAVAVHAALRRCTVLGAVSSFLVTGALGGLCVSLWLFSESKTLAELTSALLAYALLCELYLFFVTLSLGSVSANILAMLYDEPMSSTKLLIHYRGREMVVARLDRIIKAKLATLDEAHRITVTPGGVKLMMLLDQVRRFFHSGAG